MISGVDRDVVLEKILRKQTGEVDGKAAITRMLYGSLRNFLPLRKAIKSLGRQKKLPKEIEPLVIMTLYQIGYMDSIPNYAALNEGLSLIPRKFGRLKGYITWLCHEFLRNPEHFINSRSSFFPEWYTQSLEKSLGEGMVGQMEERFLRSPPVYFESFEKDMACERFLRIFPRHNIFRSENLSKNEREDLESGGAVVCDLFSLLIPGFFSGAKEGRYLDLCSSPGGKLLKALHLFPDLEFHAVEMAQGRMERLRARLKRSPLEKGQVSLHEMEGVEFLKKSKSRGDCFARILLDAPCSALGTVISHPEYLLLKDQGGVKNLPLVQKDLLQAALEVLEPGGELIYSVCTFVHEETEGHFLNDFDGSGLEVQSLNQTHWEGSHPARFGTYLLPSREGNQVFYVTKLKKGFVD